MKPDNSQPEARSQIQLKMNFSGENPLAAALRAGKFIILIEQGTPTSDQPFEPAMTLGLGLAKRLASLPTVTGMTVTDRVKSENGHDPVDTAALLEEAAGKPALLILSGKGSDQERIRDCIARAASRGIRNVLAVTGDRSDQHQLKRNAMGRVLPYANGYFDSIDTLRMIRKSTTGLFAGAGINPFKYNAADQYLQYYKMLRKLAGGAEFFMTQAGWDMKKLQEFQWFLAMREVAVPVIARLPLLSPEDIKVIHDGLYPGVHVARLFSAMLQRESNLSATQCLAAQLNRIGLQAAGCRLLGYSGISLLGIRDPKTLEMVLTKIAEDLQSYKTWKDWLAAWNEFHNFIEFSPMPKAFYSFSNLFTPERQFYSAEGGKLTSRPWPEPLLRDRCRRLWLSLTLAPYSPEWLVKTTRFMACRRCQTPDCGSRYCYYLCPKDCPKSLEYGACGGTQPDGTCEFGHARCFHHRVLALAASRHELDRLEEGISGD